MSFERISNLTRTLRFRLMLWNAVAVILTGIAVLVAVRVGVLNTLISENDVLLREDLAEILIRLKSEREDADGIDWDLLRRELEHKADGHSAHDWFVQFINSQGEIEWASDSAPKDLIIDKKTPPNTVGVSGVYRFIMVERPVADSRVAAVRVGCSQEFIAQDMRRIDQLVFAVGMLVLIVSPIGGYILAGRATAPLSQMIMTTSGLHPEKLNERLQVRGAKDELDSLAGTINDLLDRLASYLRQRHDFLANAAHELRSPLAAIRSTVEVALGGERSTQEYEELLSVVIDQCQSLEYLVNQFLLLAEVEADQLKAYSDRFSLDVLVKTAAEMFQVVAESRGISLHVEKIAITAIAGNRHHLRQVITNLIDNAIKFTAQRYNNSADPSVNDTSGAGLIEVSLTHDESKNQAILRIRDNGIGIAAEHIPQLFDRFFRVDKARTRVGDAGGTGLGLSICETIIHAHGGSLKVEGELGKGTTVTVLLPLAPSIAG